STPSASGWRATAGWSTGSPARSRSRWSTSPVRAVAGSGPRGTAWSAVTSSCSPSTSTRPAQRPPRQRTARRDPGGPDSTEPDLIGPEGTDAMTRAHDADDVSVVIPARNAEPFLADCLRSVLSQSRRASEVLVVDDHSEDATAAVARSFGAAVRVLSNPGRG